MVGIYQIVTPAASLPVTRSDAKAEFRIETTHYDDEIDRKLAVATEEVEEECRLQLLNATWKLILDRFPESDHCGPGEILIEKCPVASITSVVYVATDGTTTTLATSDYRTDLVGFPARIQPAFGLAWPATRDVSNAVTVTFVAGYGASAISAPARTKQAVLCRARELFEGCDESAFTAQLKTSLKWGDGWRKSASGA
jgi:uncharacterized phiE125 gp8 family phage protein